MPSPEQESLMASLASKQEPRSAASNFTEPARKTFAADASEAAIVSALSRSWYSLIDVAADTHHESQGPLIDIVQAVQQENLAEQEDASECTIWGDKVKVWKDMPLFGPSMRETWNRAPGSGCRNDLSAEQWCNLNAFAARLTSVSQSIPAFDFSLYAIWTLRSAFEGTDEPSLTDADAGKVWFLYAKDTIGRLSGEEKIFDGKKAKSGDKYEDKEWRGFSPERLEVWEAALRSLSFNGNLLRPTP
ncbi:hypothetical protein LCER1_G003426 [Lachnellula cervina]|uniref:Uncharacterized protein n=1 Tax=Lachnellula cervina TaxID=1316786 RepID=A0A7D8URE2_9HELO|nr:hypothetical protein LCER1_G003426 [Lachnellula cervina]